MMPECLDLQRLDLRLNLRLKLPLQSIFQPMDGESS